jgi:hypothetical protein
MIDQIIALRKFVRSGRKRQSTLGTALARLRLIPGSVGSTLSPEAPEVRAATTKWALVMKIKLFEGHREARQALVLSVAGVTAIMLIANLILIAVIEVPPHRYLKEKGHQTSSSRETASIVGKRAAPTHRTTLAHDE